MTERVRNWVDEDAEDAAQELADWFYSENENDW